MKSLDQFDPLPKLGAKVQTEVVYYHQEEKEIGEHLFIKDGKMSYRPPEPHLSATTEEELIRGLAYIWESSAVQLEAALEPAWSTFAPLTAHQTYQLKACLTTSEWPAVEEEKQDNKPLTRASVMEAMFNGEYGFASLPTIYHYAALVGPWAKETLDRAATGDTVTFPTPEDWPNCHEVKFTLRETGWEREA
jgi:hypothetical protein